MYMYIYIYIIQGDYDYRVLKGGTRILDYSSCGSLVYWAPENDSQTSGHACNLDPYSGNLIRFKFLT